MDARVLLIGDQKSFIVTSIAKELRSCGLEVIQTDPDVFEIEKIKDRPSVFLLYVDDPKDLQEIFVYTKKIVMEEDVSVSVIGSREDITKIFNNIPRERVAAVFERPFNVNDIGVRMIKVVERENERLGKKRILAVLESGADLRNLKSLLSENYQVFVVNSGNAAKELLLKTKVDLIILDYEHSVSPGHRLMEQLSCDYSTCNIPIMLLTKNAATEGAVQDLPNKPVAYLLRSMAPEAMVKKINEFF
jgi:CheY-like chemotaxis protein